MNDAHLHLLVNHFPIIGPILGLGILIVGIILKNNSVKNTAYSLFIVSAIFAAFSMGTGDGAEHAVNNLPGVTKELIHTHEGYAEKLAILLYVLGIISIGGIYLSFKNHPKSKLVSYSILFVSIVGVFIAQKVGTSGGEVRHTEIRSNALQTVGATQNTAVEDHEIKKDDDEK